MAAAAERATKTRQLMCAATMGKNRPARSEPLGRVRLRGRAPQTVDPTATGNQGRTVALEPLTGSHRADYRDSTENFRRSGSRIPSHLGDAGVRTEQRLSIFYGYTPELIARWCRVSVKTARLWKSGKSRPSRQALLLFVLHRDGKVLGPEWRGFRIEGPYLHDPGGKQARSSQIENWNVLLQWAATLAARDPKTQQEYYDLLRSVC